jgi:hypothetical protein
VSFQSEAKNPGSFLPRASQDVAFRATDYPPHPLCCGRGRASGAGEGSAFTGEAPLLPTSPVILGEATGRHSEK